MLFAVLRDDPLEDAESSFGVFRLGEADFFFPVVSGSDARLVMEAIGVAVAPRVFLRFTPSPLTKPV